MTIRFSCPSCDKTLAVADDKAGTKVACPSCKHPLRVPANGQTDHHDGTATQSRSTTAASVPAASGSGAKASRRAGTPTSLAEWGRVDGVLAGAVEALDRPLTADEEAQVRASLSRYAASVPHHDLQALGKQVKITKARELRSYRVVLDSLFEKRHSTRKEEPFEGGGVPAATVTEANIRVWSYPYATATEFRKDTKENAVEESREVRPCKTCGGRKAMKCDGCSGGGVIACLTCMTKGVTVCPRCGGEGYREVQTGTRSKPQRCNCIGGRYAGSDVVCGNCNGTGTVYREEPVYQAVPCTCGTGKVRCPKCGGHGRLPCPTCTGSGKLPCSPCKATGQMLCYLAVVQSFEPATQTLTVPYAGIKDQRIAGMLQDTDYTPLISLATTSIPTTLKLTSGAEKVRAAISKAFDAAQTQASAENRLTRQRLQVAAASVLEVSYQHGGEEYVAWFAGKKFGVHAPVNPVTDALRQKVKEAVKTWKKGEQKEAVLALNEVTEMANADPNCHTAYEDVRHTVPTDLDSKLKWHRLKPKLIAGAIVGGVAVLAVTLLIGFALFRSMSRHNGPGGVPPFVVQQPGGQPPVLQGGVAGNRLAVVLFRDRSVMIPKGGKATVRLAVQRAGRVEGDLTLKLEAPRGLTVPPQVVFEPGRQEAEVEVTAGDEAGVFTIRAVPLKFSGGPLASECRVTVGGPGLPELPGR
jgi:phage FluMu protein Com